MSSLPLIRSVKGAVLPVVKIAVDARSSLALKLIAAVASLTADSVSLGFWVSVADLFLDPYLESRWRLKQFVWRIL